MSTLEIKLIPDPVLREECEEVEEITPKILKLLDDMRETMYASRGIGLAAPQVGIPLQIVVIDISAEDGGIGYIELINPKIVFKEGKTTSEEGCLSIPGYRETIPRSARVKVQVLNRKGEMVEYDATELLAMCFQHEIDHLHGVLFTDHLSRLKRQMFKSWLKKEEIEAP